MLMEGRHRYANIQAGLRTLTGQRVSIGTSAVVGQAAQRRALQLKHAYASQRLIDSGAQYTR